ncbi:hypothetical protein OGH69_13330 [Flavobacterium sp. MFBS3-15]|uniref:hypothetical protein n=1 Tax=Flavobacterium sp. MFBS3-15 TaxID=2989816 RepID=UPI00223555CF|nr:hypothetical protein [Flavobacterium sp. MFBS3-15]MCW4469955.1 hypothetical protein [Flavobacterium sp. MFBS3-15]
MKMKLIALACLLFCGIAAQAQTLLVNNTDSAAGTRIIKTNNHKGGELSLDDSVVKGGAVFFSAGYQSATTSGKLVETYFIDLNIVHNDNRLGCLQELDSRIVLTLADGTKIECFQISESDCDKVAYHATFALMPRGGKLDTMKENFEKLLGADIAEIAIITTEGKLEYKIKKSSRDYLKQHFALIDKTVKAATK